MKIQSALFVCFSLHYCLDPYTYLNHTDITDINLPVCVSLHFCGTATVPPMWYMLRAKRVATVNAADFSAGPWIKVDCTLWADKEVGPKSEEISSISSAKKIQIRL